MRGRSILRTSPRNRSKSLGCAFSVALQVARRRFFGPFRPPQFSQIHAQSVARTPFRTRFLAEFWKVRNLSAQRIGVYATMPLRAGLRVRRAASAHARVDQGRQPSLALPLGTVCPWRFGLLGFQYGKRNDHKSSVGNRRSGCGRGCVEHVFVSQGTCRAVLGRGLGTSDAGIRIGSRRFSSHRPTKLSSGVCGDGRDQRHPDARLGTMTCCSAGSLFTRMRRRGVLRRSFAEFCKTVPCSADTVEDLAP
jgi:hypothetical protein